jgi:hypothetical protein
MQAGVNIILYIIMILYLTRRVIGKLLYYNNMYNYLIQLSYKITEKKSEVPLKLCIIIYYVCKIVI